MICQYENHQQKPIMGGCTNENCSNDRDFCFKCLQQLHNQHVQELLEFPDLTIWMQGIKDKCQIWFQLDDAIKRIIKQFYPFLSETQSEIRIEDCNHDQFNKKIDSFIFMNKAMKEFEDKLKQIQNLLIQLNKECQVFTNQNNSNQQSKINDNYQKQSKKTDQIIHKSIIKFETKFSNEWKSNSIDVNENLKIATLTKGKSGLILCQDIIQADGTCFISFRPKTCNSIYIGIVPAESKKQLEQEQIEKLGEKGCYLMSNQGKCIAPSQQNCQFKFNNNHSIIMQVNVSEKKIKWMNRDNNQTYEITIEKQQYYPCVYLSQESSIEIIEAL